MERTDKTARIKELIEILNNASRHYYAKDEAIMTDFEYDALYDELVKLEQETGIVLSNSPTVNVGYEAVDFLPKETHEKPMLSLNKTKSVEELASFAGDKDILISWKLDGLTVVLTYDRGVLLKAVTRGNGEIGEVITPNAKAFVNIPLTVDFKDKLVLRGEAVISYSDFELVNSSIDNPDEQYKNPRNLCSGSVRQLNSEITAQRHVRFVAFSLVNAENMEFETRSSQYEFLKTLGFDTVEYYKENSATVADRVAYFAERIKDFDIPSDGLVVTYDDIAYSKSLGMTAKFPRDSIAFKWQDETAQTVLREIEWSPSRTGLINPVAIFDTVELEGTSVSRASVHNISVLEELELGIGDEILVYKANMIIPQIARNITRSANISIPSHCPCCNGITEIRSVKEAKSLYCTNENCPAKQIKKFALFVSRDALNVEGLSEATLEKLIDLGYIKQYTDLFKLDRYKSEIVSMEGFGDKSYENLIDNIEKAKDTTLARVLYAMGIPAIGVATAKLIVRGLEYNIDKVVNASFDELVGLDQIGDVIAEGYVSYWADEANKATFYELISLLRLKQEAIDTSSELSSKTVVITGSLNLFDNRDALKAEIEARGGKVSGSVSKNTFVLVNNDIMSSSSKNKTAKSLGVPIMTEEDFVNEYLK